MPILGNFLGLPWGNVGTLLNPFPVPSLQSFTSDLTVIEVAGSYYFKALVGENLLITNYDFPSGWVKGFPLKSAATIDVFGQTGVPVISLFQNFDYANQYFTKQVGQVVDGNGVEISEAYVSSIVAYSAPLVDTNLTSANTYFGVPTESITAKWVSKLGNDTTGDGSKLTPWLTIQKAIDTTTEGLTIYIKSGAYTENSALKNIYLTRSVHPVAVGFVAVTATATAGSTFRTNTTPTAIVKNMVLNGLSGASYVAQLSGAGASEFKRMKYIGAGAGMEVIYNPQLKEISDSIITGTYRRGLQTNQALDILRNMFSGIGNTRAITMGAALNGGTTNIKYNRFKGDWADSVIDLNYVSTFNLAYNTIENTINAIRLIAIAANSASSCNIYFNKITIQNNLSGQALLIANNASLALNIYNNEIDQTKQGGLTGLSLINSTTIKKLNLYNNILKSIDTTISSLVAINSTDQTDTLLIYNNVFFSLNPSGYSFIAGTETTSANNNKILTEIYKNKFITNQANDDTIHGLIVGFNKNQKIYLNKVTNFAIGLILKGTVTTGFDPGFGMYNNVVVNCRTAIYFKGNRGSFAYNNTIINSINYGIGSFIGIQAIQNSGSDGSINTKLKNNIVIDSGVNNNSYLVIIDTASNTGLEIDYNIYYSNSANEAKFKIDATLYTFTEWQALGFDTHSVLLTTEQFNGLFTDFANGDYSLKAGSLAIGSGITLDAAYDDGLDTSTVWGADTALPVIVTKQQGTAWDIGAYIH